MFWEGKATKMTPTTQDDNIVDIDLSTMKALHDSVSRETYDYLIKKGKQETLAKLKEEIEKIFNESKDKWESEEDDDAIIVKSVTEYFKKEVLALLDNQSPQPEEKPANGQAGLRHLSVGETTQDKARKGEVKK